MVLATVASLPRRIVSRASIARQERALRRRTIRAAQPIFTALPGSPFDVAVSKDGAHAFVSLPGRDGGAIAVLAAAGGGWTIVRTFPLPGSPRGLAFDHDGRYLLAAAATHVLVLDARALVAGSDRVVVSTVGTDGGSIQLCVTLDNRVAFVTDEEADRLEVIDFGDSLATDSPNGRLAASVRLPPAPVGCALSVDGRHVLVTSQHGEDEGAGMLSVLDVAAAIADPKQAVLAQVPAGVRPVRVAVAPSGGTVWVTARGSNSVLGFDLSALLGGSPAKRPVAVPVGPAPVGLTLARNGALLAVANSNRFRGGKRPQTLSLIDTEAALAGRPAVLGTIPAGVFPRELATLPDDETILATNFTSRTLETVSLGAVEIHRKTASDQRFSTSR